MLEGSEANRRLIAAWLSLKEAYMTVFDAIVPMHGASNLIFYPPDYDPATNTWGGGRPINEYDPTPEQIVEMALATDE